MVDADGVLGTVVGSLFAFVGVDAFAGVVRVFLVFRTLASAEVRAFGVGAVLASRVAFVVTLALVDVDALAPVVGLMVGVDELVAGVAGAVVLFGSSVRADGVGLADAGLETGIDLEAGGGGFVVAGIVAVLAAALEATRPWPVSIHALLRRTALLFRARIRLSTRPANGAFVELTALAAVASIRLLSTVGVWHRQTGAFLRALLVASSSDRDGEEREGRGRQKEQTNAFGPCSPRGSR